MWVILAIFAAGFAYQASASRPIDRQTGAVPGSRQDKLLRLQMALDFAERPLRIALVKAQREARMRGQFIVTAALFSWAVAAIITGGLSGTSAKVGSGAAKLAEAIWEAPDLTGVYNEYVAMRDKYLAQFDAPSLGVPVPALAADVAEIIKAGFASGEFSINR